MKHKLHKDRKSFSKWALTGRSMTSTKEAILARRAKRLAKKLANLLPN
jgi:hypothetical protein